VLEELKKRPQAWVDFMMRFELGLEEPHKGRASQSALTIAASYIAGGLIPLLPYMLAAPGHALLISVAITLTALLVFGAIKRPPDGGRDSTQRHADGVDRRARCGVAYTLARLLNEPGLH
jgi:vacuolar iron transporter family protein